MENMFDFFKTLDSGVKLKLLMFAVLGFLIYRQQRSFVFALQSTKWPIASAIVTESSIDRYQNQYQPKIIFKYQYNGEEYLNDTYTYLGAALFTKKSAIRTSQEYPEDSEIRIFVNPDSPENSTIIPGIHWVQWVSIVLTAICFLTIAFIPEIISLYKSLCA